MSKPSPRTLTPETARRLAIAAQRLDQPRGDAGPDAIFEVVRQLGCVQLDPISVVARTHQLVLWSRLGSYALDDLDQLLWRERSLFEYWAHAASIVLTEDYPIHSAMMRDFQTGEDGWGRRIRDWMQTNDGLRRHILDALTERGPLLSRDFEDKAADGWASTGWTSGRNVSRMLDYLWTSGQIMVVGRKGLQKQWDLAERFLPEWTPRHTLPDDERVELAVEKALRALGPATEKHINYHYTRDRYPGMRDALRRLEAQGRVQRVQICGNGAAWPGTWYLYTDHLDRLARLEQGEWYDTTRLLSPFDNLICDRARTELLFDFRFRIEIYVPKAKREYGYYVLPILHGDRLIGRIDPQLDRKRKVLQVNAVYAEPTAPQDDATGAAVAASIAELASFLGATSIDYGGRVPDGWRRALLA